MNCSNCGSQLEQAEASCGACGAVDGVQPGAVQTSPAMPLVGSPEPKMMAYKNVEWVEL